MFDRDYQESLLLKATQKTFMKQCGGLLRPDIFDLDLQPVVERVCKEWTKKRVLTKAQLSQVAKKHDLAIKDMKVSRDHDFDEEELTTFIRDRVLRDAFSEAQALREEGAYEKAEKLVSDAFIEARLTALPGSSLPDLLVSEGKVAHRANLLPTGLRQLDEEAWKGGVGTGELAIVMARTNGGKSTFLSFLGSNALMAGKKVFHLSLEDSAGSVLSKYQSRILTQEKGSWSAIQKRLHKKGAELYIVSGSAYSWSIADIDRKAPKVDLIIVDYIDYCRPPGQSIGQDYKDLGDICAEMKRIGKNRGICVWSASQMNRVGYDQAVPDVSQVEMSMRKVMLADQVLIIHQLPKEKIPDADGNARCTLVVGKNRHGPSGGLMDAKVNWADVTFWEKGWEVKV